MSDPPYDALNLAYHVEDDPERVLTNRQRYLAWLGIEPENICLGEQVHGTRVEWVHGVSEPEDVLAETDGLLTSCVGVAVGILTADCIPVFVAAPDHGTVGLLHAGWRGIWGGILDSALTMLSEIAPLQTRKLHVALGPGIGPCCYEVSPELAEQFQGRFGNRVIQDKRHLDLYQALQVQCRDAGIPTEHTEIHDMCTACNTHDYFSYRAASGTTGRMLSTIRRLA